MMIVDNYDIIKRFLKFEEGIYYFVQVIQRRRENPDLPKNEIQRGYWYITSEKELDIHKEKIVLLCSIYNARAYISLIPRSLEKFSKLCIIEFGKRVYNKTYNNIFSLPQKVALSDETRVTKLYPKPFWLIDIDTLSDLDEIKLFILQKTEINILDVIPTVRGAHLVVECFNPNKELGDYYVSNNNYIITKSREPITLIKSCNTLLYSYFEKPSKS